LVLAIGSNRQTSKGGRLTEAPNYPINQSINMSSQRQITSESTATTTSTTTSVVDDNVTQLCNGTGAAALTSCAKYNPASMAVTCQWLLPSFFDGNCGGELEGSDAMDSNTDSNTIDDEVSTVGNKSRTSTSRSKSGGRRRGLITRRARRLAGTVTRVSRSRSSGRTTSHSNSHGSVSRSSCPSSEGEDDGSGDTEPAEDELTDDDDDDDDDEGDDTDTPYFSSDPAAPKNKQQQQQKHLQFEQQLSRTLAVGGNNNNVNAKNKNTNHKYNRDQTAIPEDIEVELAKRDADDNGDTVSMCSALDWQSMMTGQEEDGDGRNKQAGAVVTPDKYSQQGKFKGVKNESPDSGDEGYIPMMCDPRAARERMSRNTLLTLEQQQDPYPATSNNAFQASSRFTPHIIHPNSNSNTNSPRQEQPDHCEDTDDDTDAEEKRCEFFQTFPTPLLSPSRKSTGGNGNGGDANARDRGGYYTSDGGGSRSQSRSQCSSFQTNNPSQELFCLLWADQWGAATELLQEFPDYAKSVEELAGWTPLHVAVISFQSRSSAGDDDDDVDNRNTRNTSQQQQTTEETRLTFLKTILGLYPQAVHIRSHQGFTPLDYAVAPRSTNNRQEEHDQQPTSPPSTTKGSAANDASFLSDSTGGGGSSTGRKWRLRRRRRKKLLKNQQKSGSGLPVAASSASQANNNNKSSSAPPPPPAGASMIAVTKVLLEFMITSTTCTGTYDPAWKMTIEKALTMITKSHHSYLKSCGDDDEKMMIVESLSSPSRQKKLMDSDVLHVFWHQFHLLTKVLHYISKGSCGDDFNKEVYSDSVHHGNQNNLFSDQHGHVNRNQIVHAIQDFVRAREQQQEEEGVECAMMDPQQSGLGQRLSRDNNIDHGDELQLQTQPSTRNSSKQEKQGLRKLREAVLNSMRSHKQQPPPATTSSNKKRRPSLGKSLKNKLLLLPKIHEDGSKAKMNKGDINTTNNYDYGDEEEDELHDPLHLSSALPGEEEKSSRESRNRGSGSGKPSFLKSFHKTNKKQAPQQQSRQGAPVAIPVAVDTDDDGDLPSLASSGPIFTIAMATGDDDEHSLGVLHPDNEIELYVQDEGDDDDDTNVYAPTVVACGGTGGAGNENESASFTTDLTSLLGTKIIDIPNSAFVMYVNVAAAMSESDTAREPVLSLEDLLTCQPRALQLGMLNDHTSLLHECLTLHRLLQFHDPAIFIKALLVQYPHLEHVAHVDVDKVKDASGAHGSHEERSELASQKKMSAGHTPISHFMEHWMMHTVMGMLLADTDVDRSESTNNNKELLQQQHRPSSLLSKEDDVCRSVLQVLVNNSPGAMMCQNSRCELPLHAAIQMSKLQLQCHRNNDNDKREDCQSEENNNTNTKRKNKRLTRGSLGRSKEKEKKRQDMELDNDKHHRRKEQQLVAYWITLLQDMIRQYPDSLLSTVGNPSSHQSSHVHDTLQSSSSLQSLMPFMMASAEESPSLLSNNTSLADDGDDFSAGVGEDHDDGEALTDEWQWWSMFSLLTTTTNSTTTSPASSTEETESSKDAPIITHDEFYELGNLALVYHMIRTKPECIEASLLQSSKHHVSHSNSHSPRRVAPQDRSDPPEAHEKEGPLLDAPTTLHLYEERVLSEAQNEYDQIEIDLQDEQAQIISVTHQPKVLPPPSSSAAQSHPRSRLGSYDAYATDNDMPTDEEQIPNYHDDEDTDTPTDEELDVSFDEALEEITDRSVVTSVSDDVEVSAKSSSYADVNGRLGQSHTRPPKGAAPKRSYRYKSLGVLGRTYKDTGLHDDTHGQSLDENDTLSI
jgi:hypothetical protein